jgi:putative hydrolase of the HAD superfamily
MSSSSQCALILDFDGLVVDTEWPAYQAWCHIYRRFGVCLRLADWVHCVGSGYGDKFDPVVDLTMKLGRPLDRGALLREKDALKRAAVLEEPVMPGVEARIAEARSLGWAVAVASSSGAGWVEEHLGRLGLRARVDCVRTKDDVDRVKPDPAVFLAAAAGLGVAPAGCVVCEDSLNGVIAARAAGMVAVAVPNRVTRLLDFPQAHLRVESLEALSLAEVAARFLPAPPAPPGR